VQRPGKGSSLVHCEIDLASPATFNITAKKALFEIVKRSAIILGYNIANDGAEEIARRSRGTPRIANRLLRRVRDFAQVDNLSEIHQPIVQKHRRPWKSITSVSTESIERSYE